MAARTSHMRNVENDTSDCYHGIGEHEKGALLSLSDQPRGPACSAGSTPWHLPHIIRENRDEGCQEKR